MGFSAQKLRVNLKLAINRLKLLEKKKTEIALKSRKEIADYLSQNKDDRARIRVEHIIREDYLVEAMELLELYCDLLLARFGLIEAMKHCDEGLVEAVSTLIWAAPRLQSDIQEFKLISNQLGQKYGKHFLEQAAGNTNKTVNEKLINKLSPNAPPKVLVERYLVEIGKNYNIPYEPDPTVMGELADIDSSNSYDNQSYGFAGSAGGPDGPNDGFGGPSGGGGFGGPSGGGGFGGPSGGGGGFGGPSGGGGFGGPSGGGGFGGPSGGGGFGGPSGGGGGGGFGGPSGGSGGKNRIGFESYDNPGTSMPQMPSVPGPNAGLAYPPPQVNPVPPPGNVPFGQPGIHSNDQKIDPGPGYPPASTSQPPPSQSVGNLHYPPSNAPPTGPSININSLPNVTDLPDVPTASLPGSTSTIGGGSGAGDDVDFDDLNRRFEELKKRK